MRRRHTLWRDRESPIESVVYVLLLLAIIIGLVNVVLNSTSFIETRAYENALDFAQDNNINIKNLACASDDKAVNKAVCHLVTADDEAIELQCVGGWMDAYLWKVHKCEAKS